MRRYFVSKGPCSFDLMLHLSEMGERSRRAITFTCPTYADATPSYAKFKGEHLDVEIRKVLSEINRVVRFEGIAFICTDKEPTERYPNGYPIVGQPIVGWYNRDARVGEIAPLNEKLEIYIV